jgi:hypothetical protein
MDKLKLAGQNLGRVFKSRSGRMREMPSMNRETKLPNLELKTQPKQAFALLHGILMGEVSLYH